MENKNEAGLAYPFRLALWGGNSTKLKHALHVRADWALRDLRRACVRMLYLIAQESLARAVESLKRASRRVAAGGE